ncbi:MAG: Ig-like domain-containing protein, partial [Anaerolineae bacterium]
AGNSGPWKCTVGSPAAAANAVTVGAVADPGEGGVNVPYWTSRGPTVDDRIKPDVVAPGVNIMAAEAGTTTGYVNKSGTSMATPVVSGVAALMLDANGSLTTAQVKSYLTTTADDWGAPGQDIDYGYGIIDPYAAIDLASPIAGSKDTLLPAHTHIEGTLSGTGDEVWVDIPVTDTSVPIAITMILPQTQPHSNIFYWLFLGCEQPDFDMYLYSPGAADTDPYVAYSETCWRQDEFGYSPTTTGIYRLKVYSFDGSGPYVLDISGGQAAGDSTTDSPPSVTIANPIDGATLSGSVTVQIDATDTEDAAGTLTVEWRVDGGAWQAAAYNSATSYYEDTWDSTTVSDGSHTLDARATDSAANTVTAGVTVTVDNVDEPPTASIVNPVDGSAVAGSVAIQVDAADDRDAAGTLTVEVSIDGGAWQAATYKSGSGYYELDWDTTAVTDGSHSIDARATDSVANTTNAAQVTVSLDNTAPSVSMTSPAEGATVSGIIDVTADASDATGGVAQVEFFLDGSTSMGVDSDGSDGWSVTWDTTTAGNGSHTLTATATDAAGNATTSVPVTVTVSNSTPTSVSVSSVTYSTKGPHLYTTVALVDNLGNPVSGASVSIFLQKTTGDFQFWTAQGTTSDDGTVMWRLRRAPSGCYTTTVTSVSASGLNWDFITPANEFCK